MAVWISRHGGGFFRRRSVRKKRPINLVSCKKKKKKNKKKKNKKKKTGHGKDITSGLYGRHALKRVPIFRSSRLLEWKSNEHKRPLWRKNAYDFIARHRWWPDGRRVAFCAFKTNSDGFTALREVGHSALTKDRGLNGMWRVVTSTLRGGTANLSEAQAAKGMNACWGQSSQVGGHFVEIDGQAPLRALDRSIIQSNPVTSPHLAILPRTLRRSSARYFSADTILDKQTFRKRNRSGI